MASMSLFGGIMVPLMLTSTAQTLGIGPIRWSIDNGNIPCLILKSFILAMMCSIWILAFAISLFLVAFSLVNCLPFFVNGGISSTTPRSRTSDWILNPLSAIQMSPGWNRFTKWHFFYLRLVRHPSTCWWNIGNRVKWGTCYQEINSCCILIRWKWFSICFSQGRSLNENLSAVNDSMHWAMPSLEALRLMLLYCLLMASKWGVWVLHWAKISTWQ